MSAVCSDQASYGNHFLFGGTLRLLCMPKYLPSLPNFGCSLIVSLQTYGAFARVYIPPLIKGTLGRIPYTAQVSFIAECC